MRQDYQTLSNVTLGQQKDYVLKICDDQVLLELINDCMSKLPFQQIVENPTIQKQLFICALKELYQTTDYEQLEYHLMMMNTLFHNKDYDDIKKQLFTKLCKKSITINEYCVLRHLIDFKNIPFKELINAFHNHYGVEAEECARICLLEDQYHLAYDYLKQLPDCQDELLLDLLCSFSIYDYVSLIKHYARKKKMYQLAPSH